MIANQLSLKKAHSRTAMEAVTNNQKMVSMLLSSFLKRSEDVFHFRARIPSNMSVISATTIITTYHARFIDTSNSAKVRNINPNGNREYTSQIGKSRLRFTVSKIRLKV